MSGELEPIPLAKPVLGPREEELVLEVLRSGYLSLGPRVARFEADFADAVNAPHATAVSSGTAGLHLALRAVDVEAGDEVITPPFSFVASANVALYEQATPVFADIDPVTLNLDPDAAAAAITERTKAIMPVHVFGYPADMAPLERHGLAIVEDACEALGSRYGDTGELVGSRGHPAVFGFYANKQIATGEGGVITTDDPGQKQRFDSERNQGRAPNMNWLDHDRLGYNYRLSDIHCALGIAQLERLTDLLAARDRVAQLHRQHLAPLTDRGLDLPCLDAGAARRSWFVFVVQLPHGVDRDETMRDLAAVGVPAKPYFPAIHLMSYYRDRFGYRPGQFPVTEDVSARSLALPFFPEMNEGQVARVAAALGEVLERRLVALPGR
jgi:perosamine synthetase